MTIFKALTYLLPYMISFHNLPLAATQRLHLAAYDHLDGR